LKEVGENGWKLLDEKDEKRMKKMDGKIRWNLIIMYDKNEWKGLGKIGEGSGKIRKRKGL